MSRTRGKTFCSNGQTAAAVNLNAGKAATALKNQNGVITTQTSSGRKAKTKNGKGVAQGPNGTTCAKGANHLMRTLLAVTALLEAATGFALAASPSLPVSLLIGSPLDTPPGSVVGRLAGAALLTLGSVCWLARNEQRRVTAGLVAAMLFYNVAAATLLAYAHLGLGLSGIGLWPTVVLHSALALWCVACLRAR